MSSQPSRPPRTARPRSSEAGRYRWVALTNPTMAVFMSTLDGSIILIALPAIFNGIHLDPLAPANIAYLLWMIMGYRLVQAVFVVNLGRLGDILGRVRIYNAGFVVFTVASILLSQYGTLSSLTPANRNLLTGREFFPDLISGPFHDGLVLVFAVSAALGVIAAIVSLTRGSSKPPAETGAAVTPAAGARS